MVTLQQRNFFRPGDTIEFFGPEITSYQMTVGEIYDDKGKTIDAARHPLATVRFKVDQPVYPNNMMRKELKKI